MNGAPIKFVKALLLFLFLTVPRAGESDAAAGSVGASLGVKNAAVAFYVGEEHEPAAVMRVKRVHQDFERRGFFRIGVLPMVAFEGVTITIQHPESSANALAQCHEWLNARASERLELRDVQLVVAGGETNLLACGCARPQTGGRWELSGGVTLLSGTRQVTAPSARLQVTGPRAGELVTQTDRPCTNNVFSGRQFRKE